MKNTNESATDPEKITAEQDALIREVVVRHISNLVEELTVRSDIVPHVSLARRGLVGLTIASYVAAHSIGDTLGRSGMVREEAEGVLEHLVEQMSEQFAMGHVTGMAANQPCVPEAPPA